MNILFLLKKFNIGGVEMVTAALANRFVAEGHGVAVFAFEEADNPMTDRLDARVRTGVGSGLACCRENVLAIRTLIDEEKVDVIVNQWGLPFTLLRTARKAARGRSVKIVSEYHNTPDMNGRLQTIRMELDRSNNAATRLLLKTKYWLYKQITAAGMRWNYRHSDLFLVLSPSFIENFKTFTGISNPTRLAVQTNPVTVDSGGFAYDFGRKQKEIIFVGRMENEQKRIDRVLQTWALLEDRHPDWRLTIVGDGPDRDSLETLARELRLKRATFEGFQPPANYYRRASLLMLTSEYEGFGLVIVEAMCFGVVPAVYNSYAAAADIIEDGRDGLLLPFHGEGYNAHEAAQLIAPLMENDDRRNTMAKAAIKKSKSFSMDTIYKEWMDKLEKLCV